MISLLPNCSVKSGSINVIPKQKGGGVLYGCISMFLLHHMYSKCNTVYKIWELEQIP